MATRIQKFEGMEIHQNEDGFFWQEGGYFGTLDEIKADIQQWNRQFDTAFGEPYDSPSLIDHPSYDHVHMTYER